MDLFLAIQLAAGVALAIVAGYAIERAWWWRRRAEAYRRSAQFWRDRYSCGRSATDLQPAVTVVPRSAGAVEEQRAIRDFELAAFGNSRIRYPELDAAEGR